MEPATKTRADDSASDVLFKECTLDCRSFSHFYKSSTNWLPRRNDAESKFLLRRQESTDCATFTAVDGVNLVCLMAPRYKTVKMNKGTDTALFVHSLLSLNLNIKHRLASLTLICTQMQTTAAFWVKKKKSQNKEKS